MQDRIVVVAARDVCGGPIGLWTRPGSREVAQLNNETTYIRVHSNHASIWRFESGNVIWWLYDVMRRKRGTLTKTCERNVSLSWKSDNGVRTCTSVSGLTGICIVIRETIANVDTSDSRCWYIGKIITRDLRLVASRLYWMAVTRPCTTCRLYMMLKLLYLGLEMVRVECHCHSCLSIMTMRYEVNWYATWDVPMADQLHDIWAESIWEHDAANGFN